MIENDNKKGKKKIQDEDTYTNMIMSYEMQV